MWVSVNKCKHAFREFVELQRTRSYGLAFAAQSILEFQRFGVFDSVIFPMENFTLKYFYRGIFYFFLSLSWFRNLLMSSS